MDLIRLLLNWKMQLDDDRVAVVDVNAADVSGLTPLHYAMLRKVGEIAFAMRPDAFCTPKRADRPSRQSRCW